MSVSLLLSSLLDSLEKEKKVVLGMNSVDEVIRMAIISTYVANSELNNIISIDAKKY